MEEEVDASDRQESAVRVETQGLVLILLHVSS